MLLSDHCSNMSKTWKGVYEVLLASFRTLDNQCFVYVVDFGCVNGVVFFLTL